MPRCRKLNLRFRGFEPTYLLQRLTLPPATYQPFRHTAVVCAPQLTQVFLVPGAAPQNMGTFASSASSPESGPPLAMFGMVIALVLAATSVKVHAAVQVPIKVLTSALGLVRIDSHEDWPRRVSAHVPCHLPKFVSWLCKPAYACACRFHSNMFFVWNNVGYGVDSLGHHSR